LSGIGQASDDGCLFRQGPSRGSDDIDKKDILDGRTIASHHEAHPGGVP
jgi:Ser-tRNA(Ala) deacylase AlaX